MTRPKILLFVLAVVSAVAVGVYVNDRMPAAAPSGSPGGIKSEAAASAPLPDVSALVPPQAPSRWAYACELHWIGARTVEAIAGITASARSRKPTLAPPLDVRWQPTAGPAGTFAVRVDGRQLGDVVVDPHVWAPDTWTPLARAMLTGVTVPPDSTSAASAADRDEDAMLAALTNPTADRLAAESTRVSARLARSMTDAAAHEQAAFLLGVFAFRETAGAFSDVRATLGRLAAHLAVARVLRSSAHVSRAGVLAHAMAATLLGRQAEALSLLDGGSATSGPMPAAWARAVRLRITGDWRALAHPAGATLVERIEYLRAVRARLSSARALGFLDTFHPEPVPEWGRIMTDGGGSVEVGNRFFDGANAIEAAEVQSVLGRYRGDLPPDVLATDPIAVLNVQPAAGPVVLVQGSPAVRVLDWGTWAAFVQRHLAARLMLEAYHYRRVVADREAERAVNRDVETRYGGLWLAPVVRRYSVTDAAAYQQVMRDASTLCIAHPEVVTAPNWMLLYERPAFVQTRPPFPAETAWFAPALPPGTAFETEERLWGPGHSRRPTVEEMDRLAALSPYNRGLVWDVLVLRHGEPPPLEAEERAYGPFLGYDASALAGIADRARQDLPRYERTVMAICRIDPDSCTRLASFYAQTGRPAQAEAVYERWVKEARDRVRVSNGADWLVTYYRATGRRAKALAVARMAAEVYSYNGLTLYARQLEMNGDSAQAESFYQQAAERYEDVRGLLGFYLRAERREPRGGWGSKASPLLARVLGGPLEPFAMPQDSKAPVSGAVITSASIAAQRAGLQEGDIVVGLDGYRVRSYEHFNVIESLGETDDVTFILWRRDHYQEIRGTFPQRLYPISLETLRR